MLVKKLFFGLFFVSFLGFQYWFYKLTTLSVVKPKPRKFAYLKSADECFRSSAFQNAKEQKLRLPDISAYEESILKQSKGNNIFFHQTDCILDGVIHLNARHACGIESAARLHPDKQIFLMYVSPVGLLNETVLPVVDAILSFKNVHIVNVDIADYSVGTPSAEWINGKAIYSSKHINYHVADYLQMISLFKYGGTCLDLDVIVKKSLSSLKSNYIGAGNSDHVFSAVVNLAPNGIGKTISEESLKTFIATYNPDYEAMGQLALTDVLKKFCNSSLTSDMTKERCKGFQVYPEKEFYAYSWKNWRNAFEVTELDGFMQTIKDSSVLHFLHTATYAESVIKGSGVGYDILAQIHCPSVYGHVKTEL